MHDRRPFDEALIRVHGLCKIPLSSRTNLSGTWLDVPTRAHMRMNAFGTDIAKETICIFKAGASKYDALETMIDAIVATGVVTDREAFRRALFQRESIRSTGFRSVAIPHVRVDEITTPTVSVGISRDGIDFEALDSEPVNIVVLFAMPSGSDKEYLGFLAQVMMALRSPGFCGKLTSCESADDVLSVLQKYGSSTP